MFLVEGNKTIRELQNSPYQLVDLFSTNEELLSLFGDKLTLITPIELKKISFLQHPKDSVAVCKIPIQNLDKNCAFNIVLDGIQDPGNLGTIIRLADWFGIEQIICSQDTADYLNPKVIQASMGSFTRVRIIYTNLQNFLSETKNINIGTDMKGKNLYNIEFPKRINLILGNEGNGIRTETEKRLHQTITIPRFGKNKQTESLNVSMAAGIILGQIFSK